DSGFASLIRSTNGEKSGLASGVRTDPTISPPFALKPRSKYCSPSLPGAQSVTIVYTFLIPPFVAAQAPSACATCGSVNDVRTTYGDFVVSIDAVPFILTMNFLASAEMS